MIENAGEHVTEGSIGHDWPEMRGFWRIEHRTTLRSELPVILEEVETRIEATMIAEITQSGPALWLHHQICDVSMSNTPAYNQTILPDSFIEALPLKTRRATLSKSEVEAEGLKFRFETPVFYDLRGVILDEPMYESLPDEANDPRIYDQDRDGSPGLTASLIGFPAGQVSLIQKSYDSWRGEVLLDADQADAIYANSVKGVIEWGEEQRIIEASEDVLLIEVRRWIPVETSPEPTLHIFSMERVTDPKCPPRREPPRPSQ